MDSESEGTVARPDYTTPDMQPANGTTLTGTSPLDGRVMAVVLPSGGADWPQHAIESLRAQTRVPEGIVVIEAGPRATPDETERVSSVSVLAVDPRATLGQWLHQVVQSAPADYYLLQGPTDWSSPDRLSRLLLEAHRTGAELLGSSYVDVAPDRPDAFIRLSPKDHESDGEEQAVSILPETALFSRSLLDRVGGFNLQLRVATLPEFVARAAAEALAVNVETPLYFRRDSTSPSAGLGPSTRSLIESVVLVAVEERARHAPRGRRAPSEPADLGSSEDRFTPEAGGDEPERTTRAVAPTEPIFVVSGSEPLSRFVAACLGQHLQLQLVGVSSWLTEVAEAAARFLRANSSQRPGALRGETSASRKRTFAAARASVDALFSGEALSSGASGHRTRERWIGALPATPRALIGAAALYPNARFIHVVCPVDSYVSAELQATQVADPSAALYEGWLVRTHHILDTLQLLPREAVLTVRDEELLDEAEEAVLRLVEFIGETPDGSSLAVISRSLSSYGCRGSHSPAVPFSGQIEARRLSFALTGGVTRAAGDGRRAVVDRLLATDHSLDAQELPDGTIAEQPGNPYWLSHRLVARHAPTGATVCVVSKGDEMAVALPMHIGWHFPCSDDGGYAGYHPADSAEAIQQLELQRRRGADYLLIPKVYKWWLEHYASFTAHLTESYVRLPSTEDEGVLYHLGASPTSRAVATSRPEPPR